MFIKWSFHRVAILWCVLLFHDFSIGQNFNRPVPAGIPPYEFSHYDSLTDGYYLLSPFHTSNQEKVPSAPPMILNRKGYLVLYFKTEGARIYDFKYFDHAKKYSFIFVKDFSLRNRVYSDQFVLMDSLNPSNQYGGDVHEFRILSNGNYLVGDYTIDTVDLSKNLIKGAPGSSHTAIKGYVIEEFDPDHQLVFRWNSNDHINPLDAYEQYGYNPDLYNYCHGNAIEEDFDGHLLVSFRHLNAVYKINRTSGDIIWILGGKSSFFTFPDDRGFSGQHDIRRISNGNITLFDNGNSAIPPVSRAVEYRLDSVHWTANLAWEYPDSCLFFASAMGNHQTTHDRQHLINYGFSLRPNPSITHITDRGKIITNVYLADSVASYRAQIVNSSLNLNRPCIIAGKIEQGIILTASQTGENYAWSTGANTRSILATAPGVYQVWVDNDLAMVGSEPLTISDSLLISAAENDVVGIYNMLGQRVTKVIPNTLYNIHYQNHTRSRFVLGHNRKNINHNISE
jgi:hypothetical protein